MEIPEQRHSPAMPGKTAFPGRYGERASEMYRNMGENERSVFQRQNSQGQYDSRLGRWRKSGTTAGIADVQVTHEGRVYNFEIKIGKDRQSDVQRDVEARLLRAGGHYAIIKRYDDFLNEITKWKKINYCKGD